MDLRIFFAIFSIGGGLCFCAETARALSTVEKTVAEMEFSLRGGDDDPSSRGRHRSAQGPGSAMDSIEEHAI